ncbi:hypothetical protein N9B31_08490, partial [Mariniblastus sp.]|nr:hypothetical protein [bacterium]MDA7903686.1 hypothetical protein [Mariniblastus sp.]
RLQNSWGHRWFDRAQNHNSEHDPSGGMTFSPQGVAPLMNPNSNKILSSVVDSFSGVRSL